MSTETTIEWTESTWNPVAGCDKVSPGCDHCYAETIAHLFAGTKPFPDWFDVTLHPERLGQPLRWQKPRRVFVNSISDLFHDRVPDEYIARVFAVMALAHRHTFQILTKRHGRMRALLSKPTFGHLVAKQGDDYIGCQEDWLLRALLTGTPLPNVWLGVSVEDQRWADIRVPALLETPAAVRCVVLSCEPLLGPVRIDPWLGSVDWVIVGAESGPRARPMNHDWVRQLCDQCTGAGVPFFTSKTPPGAALTRSRLWTAVPGGSTPPLAPAVGARSAAGCRMASRLIRRRRGTRVRALTVHQPWAWAIAHAGKRVENRRWVTSYRGRVLVHAGAFFDPAGIDDPRVVSAGADRQLVTGMGPEQLADQIFTGRAVVAVATLVDCHPDDGPCSPWSAEGHWHWVLDDVRPIPPLPARGIQRLWTPPVDLAAAAFDAAGLEIDQ